MCPKDTQLLRYCDLSVLKTYAIIDIPSFSAILCIVRMAGKGIGKSNVLKVNIGWAVLIAGGIGAFVLARNSVLEKRQAAIRTKKRVIDTVEREAVGDKAE